MTYEELKQKLVDMALDVAKDRKPDLMDQLPWIARGAAGRIFDHELLSIPRVIDIALNHAAKDFLSMTGADLVNLLQDIKVKSEYNI